VERLGSFIREWLPKSATKKLKEWIEYVGYFEEAGEEITLPEEPAGSDGDAVQLMTAHGAKGLEFPAVFVLRLTQGAFPPWKRSVTIEFPEALMKEALPQGDYQVLEERRLCYVAMTRARENLTLVSVVKKRSKPSVFLEDLLRAPELALRDLKQLAPEVAAAAVAADPGPLPENPLAPALLHHPPSPFVYSQITRWTRASLARADKRLQLSASSIETFRQCPLHYKFAYQWKIPTGPSAAATFGNTMHAVVGRYMELRKKRAVTSAELQQMLAELWSSAGFTDPYQEEEYRRAGLEQLAAFHAAHEKTAPDVLEKQKGFTMHIAGTDVTGFIDQINRLAGRQVEIVDYKTGRPKTHQDADKDFQLSLYALAAREVLRLDPLRLIFYNLTTNEPVSTSRDEQDLRQAKERVEEVAACIRAGQFDPKPGFHCRYCDYQPLCPAHEQLIPTAPSPEPEK
jgi:ATP-dependent exoDNAse (exonuclease V) beta subunit